MSFFFESADSSSSSIAINVRDAIHPNTAQIRSLYASPSYQETIQNEHRIIIDTTDDESSCEGPRPSCLKRKQNTSNSPEGHHPEIEVTLFLSTSKLLVES